MHNQIIAALAAWGQKSPNGCRSQSEHYAVTLTGQIIASLKRLQGVWAEALGCGYAAETLYSIREEAKTLDMSLKGITLRDMFFRKCDIFVFMHADDLKRLWTFAGVTDLVSQEYMWTLVYSNLVLLQKIELSKDMFSTFRSLIYLLILNSQNSL